VKPGSLGGRDRVILTAVAPTRGTLLKCYRRIIIGHRRSRAETFTLDKQTYAVCLDSGRELAYSLERMASC
jgi:hypothetical protein